MMTGVVEYTIDPDQIDAFERFARAWINLVNRHGGVHHGYFLPSEGASDRALALFSFPSLAGYEKYRALFGLTPSSLRRTKYVTTRSAFFATSAHFCDRFLSEHSQQLVTESVPNSLKARGSEFLQFVVTVERLDGANSARPRAHDERLRGGAEVVEAHAP
jgi:hypothetical protein